MSDRLLKESDVIEAFKGRESLIHDVYTATAIIRSVPSADRPQGEWIYCEDYVGHDGYKCSECGFFVPWCYDVYADSNFIRHYHTCPHCGARMKGADDE